MPEQHKSREHLAGSKLPEDSRQKAPDLSSLWDKWLEVIILQQDHRSTGSGKEDRRSRKHPSIILSGALNLEPVLLRVLRGVLLRAVETSGYKEFIFKALIRKQVSLGSSEGRATLVFISDTSGDLRATQAPCFSCGCY